MTTFEYNIEEIFLEIKSTDPMVFEGAFYALLPNVNLYKDRIIGMLHQESDTKIKGRYVELLGECRDANLLLEHCNDEITPWALTALEKIGSKEALKIVSEFKAANHKWL